MSRWTGSTKTGSDYVALDWFGKQATKVELDCVEPRRGAGEGLRQLPEVLRAGDASEGVLREKAGTPAGA